MKKKKKTVNIRCDKCREPIVKPSHGVLEWIANQKDEDNFHVNKWHLVHDDIHSPTGRSCRYAPKKTKDGVLGDRPLKDLLGPDGLMVLLDKLIEDEFPRDDVLELIKRLHVPLYEQARGHIEGAIQDEVIVKWSHEPGFWTQSQLTNVLKYIESNSPR